MKHVARNRLHWNTLPGRGVGKAEVMRNAEGGGLAFWNVPRGAGFARHSHHGFEAIYVVSGRMNFDGHALAAGDVLLTGRGETHEAVALEDAVILVFNERDNTGAR